MRVFVHPEGLLSCSIAFEAKGVLKEGTFPLHLGRQLAHLVFVGVEMGVFEQFFGDWQARTERGVLMGEVLAELADVPVSIVVGVQRLSMDDHEESIFELVDCVGVDSGDVETDLLDVEIGDCEGILDLPASFPFGH